FMEAFRLIKKRIHIPIAKQIEEDLNTCDFANAVKLLLEYFYDQSYEYTNNQYTDKQKITIQASKVEHELQQLLYSIHNYSLLNEINNDDYSNLRVQRIFVRNKEKYQTLEKMFGITLYTDMDAFLDGGIDIVVEAANIEAVVDLLPHVIKKKESVIISIGALADKKFLSEITELADVYQHAVHLPSGAIGGLDLLQNADAMGSITNVSLTTRKPADSLIDYSIDEPVIVYEGTAANAIKKFPKNINVSIILSLAGLGMDATKVTIIADPQMEKNEHHVE